MVAMQPFCDIEERVNYDAYGSPIGTFTAVNNRKGYAGYEYDAVLSETYHVRHRVYRSDLGVWTRRDPLGYVDGMNLYGYVMQSPVNDIDSKGLSHADNKCLENPPQMTSVNVTLGTVIPTVSSNPEGNGRCCRNEYAKNKDKIQFAVILAADRQCKRSSLAFWWPSYVKNNCPEGQKCGPPWTATASVNHVCNGGVVSYDYPCRTLRGTDVACTIQFSGIDTTIVVRLRLGTCQSDSASVPTSYGIPDNAGNPFII